MGSLVCASVRLAMCGLTIVVRMDLNDRLEPHGGLAGCMRANEPAGPKRSGGPVASDDGSISLRSPTPP